MLPFFRTSSYKNTYWGLLLIGILVDSDSTFFNSSLFLYLCESKRMSEINKFHLIKAIKLCNIFSFSDALYSIKDSGTFKTNYHMPYWSWGIRATISHINYWDQVNSWKNLWKFWNGPLCRNKSGPSPLLNVAVYWQSSDTKLVSRNCLRYLQTTLIMGGGGLVSEFMWGIVVTENTDKHKESFFDLEYQKRMKVSSWLLPYKRPTNF